MWGEWTDLDPEGGQNHRKVVSSGKPPENPQSAPWLLHEEGSRGRTVEKIRFSQLPRF